MPRERVSGRVCVARPCVVPRGCGTMYVLAVCGGVGLRANGNGHGRWTVLTLFAFVVSPPFMSFGIQLPFALMLRVGLLLSFFTPPPSPLPSLRLTRALFPPAPPPSSDLMPQLSDPSGKVIIHKRAVSEHAFAFHTPPNPPTTRGAPPPAPLLYKLCLRASRINLRGRSLQPPALARGESAVRTTARRVRVELKRGGPRPSPPPGLLIDAHAAAVAATLADLNASVDALVAGVSDLRARAELVERASEGVAAWVVGGGALGCALLLGLGGGGVAWATAGVLERAARAKRGV